LISLEAVNFLSEKVYNEDPTQWMPEAFIIKSHHVPPIAMCVWAWKVVYPVTDKTITKYQKLVKYPHMK